MRSISFLFPLTLVLFLTTQTQAFLTVQESNEIAPVGKYKLGIEPQVRTSNGSGSNVTGFFDAPVNEELSLRALVGTGDTDLVTGGSVKWVPYPDWENQPALGGKASAIFWREANQSYFTYRFEPIVSKKFETKIGTMTPYGALPVMFTTGDGTTVTAFQLAGGVEYLNPKADNMTFGVELGTSMKDSFSYISGYVTIFVDEIKPLKK